jgi:hypothetical protein
MEEGGGGDRARPGLSGREELVGQEKAWMSCESNRGAYGTLKWKCSVNFDRRREAPPEKAAMVALPSQHADE